MHFPFPTWRSFAHFSISGDSEQQQLTFDLVGGGSPHFSFTVFHEVLEGRDQVGFGDFWPDCFLELWERGKQK